MNSLYKQALLGSKLIGAALRSKEVRRRSLAKIPLAGAFVPPTNSMKVERKVKRVNNIAKQGRGAMDDARRGKFKGSTFGSNKKPSLGIPDIDKEAVASLQKTYEDMIELQKEASMKDIFGGALAVAGASALMTAGGVGANKLYKKIKTERIWNRLKKDSPDLTQNSKDRENFEVLQTFSPDIAGNITTARSYLQRAQQTYMAPHEFVKDLASVQDVRDRSSFGKRIEDIAQQSSAEGMNYNKMVNDKKMNLARKKEFNKTFKQREVHFGDAADQSRRRDKEQKNQFNLSYGQRERHFFGKLGSLRAAMDSVTEDV